ncbi:MAG: hypothetical protein Q9218_000930 [Villophora microphyllina]
MPAPYEIRAGGDVKNKKQSMADLKLRRLNELNSRLREDLERPRIRVSEASMSIQKTSWCHLYGDRQHHLVRCRKALPVFLRRKNAIGTAPAYFPQWTTQKHLAHVE